MPPRTIVLAGLILSSILMVAPCTSRADFIVVANPYSGDYLTATSKIALPAVGSTYSSISDGVQTITMSASPTAMEMSTLGGAGTSFGWGSPPNVEQSDPLVMFTGPDGNHTTNDVTLTFGVPVTTFGVEMMPNYPTFFFPYTMTAAFYDGDTLVGSISQGITSPGGARLFAASTSDGVFTRVELTAQFGNFPFGTHGFEVAQFRYTAVPEPSSLALLCLGLASIGCSVDRRRRRPLVGDHQNLR